jgi:hypothetical protein
MRRSCTIRLAWLDDSAVGAELPGGDPELSIVVDAWPWLQAAIQAANLALAQIAR